MRMEEKNKKNATHQMRPQRAIFNPAPASCRRRDAGNAFFHAKLPFAQYPRVPEAIL